jgi:O-antigen/teichoic acid export membrane protein
MLIFLSGQGDQVLVARNIGFAALGYYSAVILLILYPTASLLWFVHTVYMPLIAATREDRAKRAAISYRLGSETVLLSLCMAAGFALVAPFVIPLLYGHRFAQSVLTVALIGILQCTRYIAVWPTTVGLGMGRSSIVMANNLVRLIAWPAAIAGVLLGLGLIGIVLGFIFGELVAAAWALVMLNRSENNNLLHGFDYLAMFVAGSIIIIGWVLLPVHFSGIRLAVLMLASGAVATWAVSSGAAAILEAYVLLKKFVGQRG